MGAGWQDSRREASFPFLLVEGDDLDGGPRHPNAIRGAMLAIADLGIAIIRSRDPVDSALWIHRLAIRQARRGTRPEHPRGRARMNPPGISVLAAVPGISDRTAHTLLERFGSVGGVLDAGPERWAEVAGIGAVRAHALSEALLNGLEPGGVALPHASGVPATDGAARGAAA